MANLKNLLFGLKANEPVPASVEELVKQMARLELLADFVEAQNMEEGEFEKVHGQMEKARVDQIQNAAGGFVFRVNDVNRIRRFLILGTSGGTYYTSEKELTMENVGDLCEIIQKGKGVTLLREILEISLGGRAPKQNSTLFALALCARYKVCDTMDKKSGEKWEEFSKRSFSGCSFQQQAPLQCYLDYQRGLQLAAFQAVSKVCRIPTHLFMFIKYCKLISSSTGMKQNSSGWGRALRETVSQWYFNFGPERLAEMVTKYQSREGYSHRDLFRLCHIAPKVTFPEDHQYWKNHAEYDFLFKYIVKGFNNDSQKRKAISELAELPEKGQKRRKGHGDMQTHAEQVAEVLGEQKKDELRGKVQQLFKLDWDEGLDKATKKAIRRKMELFVSGAAEEMLAEAAKKEARSERRKDEKAQANLHLQEKKGAVHQDLEVTETYSYIKAFETLKQMTEPAEVVKMIKDYGFAREHVPSNLLNSQEVWAALLENMPMTAMIRNLGKMASIGLLNKEDSHRVYVDKVVTKLTNEKAIHGARIHPISVLLASSVYRAGCGIKGKLSWDPVDEINDALEKAFLLAFKNVMPTGKRYCLALDVSGSMGSYISETHLECREASAALSMVLLRTEPLVEAVAFTSELLELPFNKTTPLKEILEYTENLDFGSTDCAQPMLWALEKKKEFDVFVVYTDNETWFGGIHPFEALKRYRKEMQIPDARLVVMGMTATECSIADPTDAGMLDICGFDSAVPELLKEFVLGRI